jgi:putative oxidoreductase
MTNILDLIARFFISLIFLLSGINKIGNYEGTVGWMESLGIPGIFLIPAIILEIGASILIIAGYKVKISAALLSVFCLATAIGPSPALFPLVIFTLSISLKHN